VTHKEFARAAVRRSISDVLGPSPARLGSLLTDADDAHRREVHQHRYASLDRIIQRDERLMVLESIGLAESTGPKTWRVRRNFVNVLRAMQRSADRRKTLAAHGALISDERLQMTVLDLRSLTTLEGRILVHGEEESSERSYLMLEGTDASPLCLLHTRNRSGPKSRRAANEFFRSTSKVECRRPPGARNR
jgi:hypothetical protein